MIMGELQKSTRGFGMVNVRGLRRVPYPKIYVMKLVRRGRRTSNQYESFHNDDVTVTNLGGD